jgi:glutathione S-transferase
MTDMDWILRTSMASPFGRKIRMALAAIDRLKDTEIVIADTSNPADTLHQQNPLGKVPVLLIDDSLTLFDSRAIVDFLDDADGHHTLIPAAGPDKYVVLAQQALADGIIDAALLQLYEVRARPEAKRHDEWVAYQQRKIDRALSAFSKRPPNQGAIGEIALAAALGYLDLRFEGRWRASHPPLVTWLDEFARRFPAFEATRPS